MKQSATENNYVTAMGSEEGKTLIFRCLEDLPEGAKETDYPNLLSIYWSYNSPNENGMPDSATNETQIEFEDAVQEFDEVGFSHLALVVTGNGRKEWHWYAHNIEAWMERLNNRLADKPPFPIEIRLNEANDWSLYHGLKSSLAAEASDE